MISENMKFGEFKFENFSAKGSLRRIFLFVAAYPVRSILMLIGMLFSGIAEGVSLLVLLPLLEFPNKGGTGEQSKIVQFIVDAFVQLDLEPSFGALLVVIAVGILLKSLFLFIAMLQAGYTSAYIQCDLRRQLIGSLLKARWEYFISKPTGVFANAVSSEVDRAITVYDHAVLATANIVQVSIYWFVSVMISWQISLAALIIVGILFFVMKGLMNTTRSAGETRTKLMKTLMSSLTEFLYSLKPIKAMAIENRFQRLLDKKIQGLKLAQCRQVFASQLLRSVQEPLLVSMVMVGLYLAVTYGGKSLSELLVIAFVFYRLVGRIFVIQGCYVAIGVDESALHSLHENINGAKEAREDCGDRQVTPVFNREISLESVEFSHGETVILKDMSMKITAGQLMTIYGLSGVGKTTVVDLIIGLYQYHAGKILIDDVDLKDIDLKAWRRMVGYIPQEMFLFHDTIYNNITMGDDDITEECVEESLRAARAWEFVSNLPKGLNTEIGERGSKISGGQRQRISVARALARKPKLLILDEITTSLDTKTEAEICQTLHGLRGKVTMISISHQKAMLDVADVVYCLQDGHVQEEMVPYN